MNKLKTDSYVLFKPIKNLIGKYDTLSLVIAITKKIHEIEEKPFYEWKGWLPWYLLLLIKWSFQFGSKKSPPKQVTEKSLVTIINKIRKFDGDCGSPFLNNSDHRNASKFFRTIAFQQFWLQRNIGSWDLARQYILICGLPKNNLIQTQFAKTYGISMEQFLEMSFLLWTWLTKNTANYIFNPKVIFKDIDFSETQIQQYFKALALCPSETVTFFTSKTRPINDPCFQIKEISPLLEKPILILNEQLLVYSRQLFEKNINEYFYNQVKRIGGSPASVIFAKRLEIYVKDALQSVGLPFICENDLKNKFPGCKVPDFLITLPNCTVFLEVKSVEMKPLAQVYPDNQVLINELEDSVIKATIQGLSLATKLTKINKTIHRLYTLPPFLLILTYKDHYLGDGQSVWDEFLFSAVNSSPLNKEIDLQSIPADHIIILSLYEFDLLMSCLHQSQSLLEEILTNVIKNNLNQETRKFTFSQHLDQYLQSEINLSYLDIAFNELSSKISSKFRS